MVQIKNELNKFLNLRAHKDTPFTDRAPQIITNKKSTVVKILSRIFLIQIALEERKGIDQCTELMFFFKEKKEQKNTIHYYIASMLTYPSTQFMEKLMP